MAALAPACRGVRRQCVTVGALAITTLAFVYEGFPTTEVDLHDGGVWVTKQSSLLVGHFNHESQVLDGGLRTTTDDYDVLQSGSTVVVDRQTPTRRHDGRPGDGGAERVRRCPGGREGRARRPDARDPRAGDGFALGSPGRSTRLVRGRRHRPHRTNSARRADVTVSPDGTVFAVSPDDGTIVTIGTDAEGAPDRLRHEGARRDPRRRDRHDHGGRSDGGRARRRRP